MPDWDSYGQLDSVAGDIRYIIAWNHRPEQSGPIRVHGSSEQVTEDRITRVSYAVEYIPAGAARTIRFPNGKIELEIPALKEPLYFGIASGYGYDVDMPTGKVVLCGGDAYYITGLRPPSPGQEGEELRNGTDAPAELTIKFHHEGTYDREQLDVCYYDMPNTKWGPRPRKLVKFEDNTVVHRTKLLGMYALMARKEPSYSETIKRLDETVTAANDLKAAITQVASATANSGGRRVA